MTIDLALRSALMVSASCLGLAVVRPRACVAPERGRSLDGRRRPTACSVESGSRARGDSDLALADTRQEALVRVVACLSCECRSGVAPRGHWSGSVSHAHHDRRRPPGAQRVELFALSIGASNSAGTTFVRPGHCNGRRTGSSSSTTPNGRIAVIACGDARRRPSFEVPLRPERARRPHPMAPARAGNTSMELSTPFRNWTV